MKKLVIAGVALAVVLLVAVGGYFGWKYYGPIHAAKEAVKLKLKDPSSAQFRNVRTVGMGFMVPIKERHTGHETVTPGMGVCGEVNTKNLFGAYIGFTPFYVVVPYFPTPFQPTQEMLARGEYDADISRESNTKDPNELASIILENLNVLSKCREVEK